LARYNARALIHIKIMLKALIYCRVSTEEQAEQGYSLDAQEKLCRAFALNNGYSVAGIYRDEGRSGTSLDRPALKDLLAKCQDKQSISAVLVQETDRLARNTQDHLAIKTLLSKAEVKLISVNQPMLDDSPEGNMIDTIIASVNQFQSDLNSRKTKKGLQQKFDEGGWPSQAPPGYLNVSVGPNIEGIRAQKTVKIDPQRWNLVKEGFVLYLTGDYSADHVNDILYKKGLRSKKDKKFSHSVIISTLKNPFYAGIMQWNKQEKIGKYPPMITVSQHKKVLEIMNSNNNFACRRRKHDFLLRGFIFCDICGQRYVGEKHPAKNKEYYHCGSRRLHDNLGQNVEVSDLEKQIEEQFKHVQFSDEFIARVLEKLKNLYQHRNGEISGQTQILYNRKKAIEARRNVAEQKLLKGVLKDEAFTRLRDGFTISLDAIQSQIDELSEQRELQIDVIAEVIKLSRDIYKAYKIATPELRRHYIALFWEQFLVRDKEIIKAIPTKIIIALQKEQKVRLSSKWLPLSPLNLTLMDWQYMGMLKERLSNIKVLLKAA
jgi:DNA invertase Pin-like site-specific DNA recombinase